MKTITFRWEQDGNGGDHGRATYFPNTQYEATVVLPTFLEAHELQMSIEVAMKCAAEGARMRALNQVRGLIERMESK